MYALYFILSLVVCWSLGAGIGVLFLYSGWTSVSMVSDSKSFEESLNQLNDIVNKMSGGKTSLEESLKLFEDGIRLVGACKKKLTEAEQKVQMLTNQNNGNAGQLQDVVIDGNSVTPTAGIRTHDVNNDMDQRYHGQRTAKLNEDNIPF